MLLSSARRTGGDGKGLRYSAAQPDAADREPRSAAGTVSGAVGATAPLTACYWLRIPSICVSYCLVYCAMAEEVPPAAAIASSMFSM